MAAEFKEVIIELELSKEEMGILVEGMNMLSSNGYSLLSAIKYCNVDARWNITETSIVFTGDTVFDVSAPEYSTEIYEQYADKLEKNISVFWDRLNKFFKVIKENKGVPYSSDLIEFVNTEPKYVTDMMLGMKNFIKIRNGVDVKSIYNNFDYSLFNIKRENVAVCIITGKLSISKYQRDVERVNLYGNEVYVSRDVVKDLRTISDLSVKVFKKDPAFDLVSMYGSKSKVQRGYIKSNSSHFIFSKFEGCYGNKNQESVFLGNTRFGTKFIKYDGKKSIHQDTASYKHGAEGQPYFLSHSQRTEERAKESPLREYTARHEVNAVDMFGFNTNGVETAKPKKDTTYFGMEIELEKGVNASVTSHDLMMNEMELLEARFVLSYDGSLRNGVEIKSQPQTADVLKKSLEKLYAFTRPRGLVALPSCGLHIHVSRDALSEMQIARLMTFLYAPRNRTFIEKVSRREGNRYCKNDLKLGFAANGKSVKLRSETYKDVGRYMDEDDEEKQKRYFRGGDRYTALNLTSNNTVEFRIFAGADNLTDALVSLEFVESLLRFTTPGLISLRPVEYANYEKYVDFLSDASNRKDFPNLCSMLNITPKKSVPKKIKNKVA